MGDEAASKRKPRLTLTQSVTDALRKQITDGDVEPGQKLPAEPMLIKQFGVSRTVVREALSALKADGYVEPRHGSGVFVLDPADRKSDHALFNVDRDRASSVLEALELRAGVEIEAAGLAAMRRSPAQEAKIAEAFEALRTATIGGQSASDADRQFHSAIAQATNNPFFKEFLDFVTQRTIVEPGKMGHGTDAAKKLRQTRNFTEEHRAILTAISDQNIDAAREAMRAHLVASRERIRNQNRQGALED